MPESLSGLGRQRDRWQRGLADVLWRHRRMMLNPRYGALGMVVMPYFVAVELCGPIIEALGLVGLAISLPLGVVDLNFAIMIFLAAYGYGLILSAATLVLEDLAARAYDRVADRLVMLPWVVLESFGYRQLTVWWRLRGLWGYLRGRQDWGAMARSGFQTETQPD